MSSTNKSGFVTPQIFLKDLDFPMDLAQLQMILLVFVQTEL